MKVLVSVVVPAYNEASNLPGLVAAIAEAFRSLDSYALECIVVNDGSTDNTGQVLRRLSVQYSCLRSIHMRQNSGQSAALIAGLRSSKGSILVTLDADLQNDPADIPLLLDALGSADFVSGYRQRRHDSLFRRLTSYLGNQLRRRIVDDGIRDAGCGLKAFDRACLEHIIPFHGVHRFFAAMVRNGGLRVKEIPVRHHPRQNGESKYGFFNRFFWVLQDFFGVAWLKKRYLLIAFDEDIVPLAVPKSEMTELPVFRTVVREQKDTVHV
ncbi:MAG: glycosyltransferase family 2 protein [Candidatus Hydrogenedens sp.]|nr:glycosyltransferase family 2 protein [Candidatus Hydrogenedens sp.]